jgi:hypothetical protein
MKDPTVPAPSHDPFAMLPRHDYSAKDRTLARLVNTPPATPDPFPLRNLALCRLRTAFKAVWRLPTRQDLDATLVGSIFCERCKKWSKQKFYVGSEYTCTGCDTIYVAETIVFTATSHTDDHQ